MPSLESLEQFNSILVEIGNEPEVAATRGETVEAVAQPTPDEFRSDAPVEEAVAAPAPADDFFANLSESIESSETEEVEGLGLPPESLLSDLGLEDDELQLQDLNLDLPDEDFFGSGETVDPGALSPEPPLSSADFDDVPDDRADAAVEKPPGKVVRGDLAIAGVGQAGKAVVGRDRAASTRTDAAVKATPAPDTDMSDFDSAFEQEFSDSVEGATEQDGASFDMENDFSEEFGANFDTGNFGGDGDDFDFGDEGDGSEAFAGVEDFAQVESEKELAAGITEDFDSSDFGGEFDTVEDLDSADFGDEFSMGEFGDEFGVMQEESVDVDQAEFAASGATEEESLGEAAAEDEVAGFAISDEDFETFKKVIDNLPLNLKTAVSELMVGDEYPIEKVTSLIDALVGKKSARELAAIVSAITGKKLEIPKGYEKRSGISFEEESKSFAYQFKETIWPVMRLALVGTALLASVLFLGYRYVYQPLFARSLYEQGLANIEEQEYESANRFFDQAYEVWPVNQRFFDYARAFIAERRYDHAREKYETLLSDAIDPLNRDAILEYARFATFELRDYEASLKYLQRLIVEDTWDYEALLYQGDTYFEWAIQSSDLNFRAQQLERARFTYAGLMDQYGQIDELLFRMLRYFINTGNVADALNLKDLFLNDEKATLDPYGMTELGGFLLDVSQDEVSAVQETDVDEIMENFVAGLRGVDSGTNLVEDAFKVLNKAMELNDEIPDIHYHRARYSRITGDLRDEITALNNAVELYNELQTQRPLSRNEIRREIDAYIRQAENFQKLDELISAQTRFMDAANLYQRALEAGKIRPQAMFGRLYAALGDIYYYEANDYQQALDYYRQARANRYGSLDDNPELFAQRQDIAYKIAYIHLYDANALNVENRIDETNRQDRLDEAITEFNNAMGAIPTANVNLLYARANTQYMRGNYNDAVSMYRILLDELTGERGRISTFLLEEDDSSVSLIDFQIRVNNNLGVSLYQLYRQQGRNTGDLLAQSQLYLARSAELSENLHRDVETAVRGDSKPLAFLNLTRILGSGFEDAVYIDPDIRKDLSTRFF